VANTRIIKGRILPHLAPRGAGVCEGQFVIGRLSAIINRPYFYYFKDPGPHDQVFNVRINNDPTADFNIKNVEG
jgi:hypothetical protein